MERSGSLNEIVALWIGIIREKSFVIGIDGGRSMGGRSNFNQNNSSVRRDVSSPTNRWYFVFSNKMREREREKERKDEFFLKIP